MATGLNVGNFNSGVVWHPKVKWPAMQENGVLAVMDEGIDLTMKNSFHLFQTKAQRFK